VNFFAFRFHRSPKSEKTPKDPTPELPFKYLQSFD
jgi:hypothetical protein